MYQKLEEITAWLEAEGFDTIVTSTEFSQDSYDERMNLTIQLAVLPLSSTTKESAEDRFIRAMEILDNAKQK